MVKVRKQLRKLAKSGFITDYGLINVGYCKARNRLNYENPERHEAELSESSGLQNLDMGDDKNTHNASETNISPNIDQQNAPNTHPLVSMKNWKGNGKYSKGECELEYY